MVPTTRSQAVRTKVITRANKTSDSPLRKPVSANTTSNSLRSADSFSEVPPVYTIDLSLPPRERYVKVATDFQLVVKDLPLLFDEILSIWGLPIQPLHFLSHLFLRRLHSHEQTEELRGISDVAGIPMYLLVAFNVFLDLFMGCTSGGILTEDSKNDAKPKMVHFRTLDWDMRQLRKIIVQFDFIAKKGGPVIASAINYVGYVGFLTAVKPSLSMSLNFRPYHNDDTSHWTNMKYRYHQLLVILGFRPSISSVLQDLFLPPDGSDALSTLRLKYENRTTWSIGDIAQHFPSIRTTAAYLIFCDGTQTLLLEKDRITARPILSSSFLAATNHDVSYEESDNTQAAHRAHAQKEKFNLAMEEIVKESIARKGCMASKWEKLGTKREKDQGPESEGGPHIKMVRLKRWMREYPVRNEQTHFAAIMDPKKGKVAWVRCFEEDAEEGWVEEKAK